MNDHNLTPFERGAERTVVNARLGGIASGRARRAAAARGINYKTWKRETTFAGAARVLLNQRACGKKGRGENGKTNAVVIVEALYKKAQQGSVRAAKLLAQLMGEMVKTVDVSARAPVIRDDVPRCELEREVEDETGIALDGVDG